MEPDSCVRCDQDEAIARGLCRACYDYKRKFKRDRPERLWTDEEHLVRTAIARFNRRLLKQDC